MWGPHRGPNCERRKNRSAVRTLRSPRDRRRLGAVVGCDNVDRVRVGLKIQLERSRTDVAGPDLRYFTAGQFAGAVASVSTRPGERPVVVIRQDAVAFNRGA